MPGELTNRDLYLAVRTLGAGHHGSTRTLEEYLRALWQLARLLRERAALTGEELIRLLGEAWTAPAPPFDERWRTLVAEAGARPGFGRWEGQILGQIRDQRELEEAGAFDNEYLAFGVDAPGGGRWYNFHPAGYLEAAAQGTFGGWQPGDEGRIQVPGLVAVLGADGTVTSVDASEIDHPVEPLGEITWERFADFLYWGQSYE